MSGPHEGLRLGLLATATGLGFRHGIDWDHLAAITDLTAAQDNPRTAFGYACCYFAGHGAVLATLGAAAIVAGEHVPRSVDAVMERVVGATLCALGIYVLLSLIRNGRDFRMRSRWMLVFAGVRKIGARIRPAPAGARTSDSGGHHHGSGRLTAGDEGFWAYGPLTSVAVGSLHGIGAETPTQVLLLAAAATAGGAAPGMLLLAAFLLGLFASNSVVGLTVAFGFLGASRNFALYATVSVLTGLAGLVVGVLLVTGRSSLLPALFG
jgi:cytochrome c biogenesis protein CcdA